MYRDAVAVAIGDAATSIFAGFVVFSFMGFLANEMNMDVEKLVDDGMLITADARLISSNCNSYYSI